MYYSDALMKRAIRMGNEKYTLKKTSEIQNLDRNWLGDEKWYKAKPAVAAVLGSGLVAGILMAIGWGFIAGYALHLNTGAAIVGLVFSTIGMGIGAMILGAFLGLGAAYLVYKSQAARSYSATR